MDDAPQGAEGSKKAPPYISYQTLKTLLSDFKDHGVPGRIDRSVLTRFSGGVGTQVKSALRFLGLIDDADKPKEALEVLTAAYGTDEWTETLGTLLRRMYAPVFQLQLQSASPGQFVETFRKAYPGKDETVRKCITFFLNALKDAEIPVSPYILKGTKTRSAPTKRAPAAKKTPKPEREPEPEQEEEKPEEKPNVTGQTPEQVLLDILDPKMEAEEQKAVFTLLLYLKKKAAS